MKLKKARLLFEKEFPTMKCEKCDMEFVLLGVIRKVNEHGQETIDYWEQQAARLFCPYCGKGGR